MNLHMLGRMYVSDGRLWEVVALGVVGGFHLRPLDGRSDAMWATGVGLAKMTRLVPEDCVALEALWALPAAKRLSGTAAQERT